MHNIVSLELLENTKSVNDDDNKPSTSSFETFEANADET